MLATCEANAGLYTKLAQALGSQGAVLPKPYLQLAKLLDDAERMDWEVVRKVIEKDRGAPVEELFHSIDHTPLAAASIAQVHVARLKTPSGEPGAAVAVKVQRPEIIAQAGWDLLCFRLMLHVYERIFDLPMSAFGQYISQQTLNETSFVKEAANATALRKAVESDPMRLIRETVMVPRIYEELSGEQVLVMDYIPHAAKMTDVKRIEEMGLSVKEATRSVCEVFSR
jgi:aarF domain-containing kinase